MKNRRFPMPCKKTVDNSDLENAARAARRLERLHFPPHGPALPQRTAKRPRTGFEAGGRGVRVRQRRGVRPLADAVSPDEAADRNPGKPPLGGRDLFLPRPEALRTA